MQITVITATIGERTPLYTPRVVRSDVRYVAFSDRPIESKAWEVIRVDQELSDPCRDAKRYKVLADIFVQTDASIWIDHSARLICDPVELFDQFEEDLLFVRHYRSCIFAEGRAIIRSKKDNPVQVKKTLDRFRSEGWPLANGLFYGTCFARRHTEATFRFSRDWWAYIEQGSRRDQLSLPVALDRSGVSVRKWKRKRRPEFFKMLGGR